MTKWSEYLRDKKPNIGDLTSTATLLILVIQVMLLTLLSIRVMNLEKVITGLSGGNRQSPIIEVDRIPDERGEVFGPANAMVTIVTFSDFQCPYCNKSYEVIKELMGKYPGQIRLVFRNFPLTSIHAEAFNAAISAECAGEQGRFWEMHDLIFAHQEELSMENLSSFAGEIGLNVENFNHCVISGAKKEMIEKDIADGKRYGVTGTPTIFLNKRQVNVSELEVEIQKLLLDK